ncbi:MAG: antibiotic biosynthesis monooxygenase [Clostridiales bacterium]|nr:antibiotic biosynthesis monooxygenase [Clostridiales bacterium]
MIIVHAFIEVKDGMAQEFIKAAAKCVEATRQENGNNFYTLYTDSFDPLKFVVVEEWESQSALDAHMQTPHFITFGGEIENLLAAPLDIKVFEAALVTS